MTNMTTQQWRAALADAIRRGQLAAAAVEDATVALERARFAAADATERRVRAEYGLALAEQDCPVCGAGAGRVCAGGLGSHVGRVDAWRAVQA